MGIRANFVGLLGENFMKSPYVVDSHGLFWVHKVILFQKIGINVGRAERARV